MAPDDREIGRYIFIAGGELLNRCDVEAGVRTKRPLDRPLVVRKPFFVDATYLVVAGAVVMFASAFGYAG